MINHNGRNRAALAVLVCLPIYLSLPFVLPMILGSEERVKRLLEDLGRFVLSGVCAWLGYWVAGKLFPEARDTPEGSETSGATSTSTRA